MEDKKEFVFIKIFNPYSARIRADPSSIWSTLDREIFNLDPWSRELEDAMESVLLGGPDR